MHNEIQADWRDLCLHASTETDPVKLISLVEKILQTFADLDDTRRINSAGSSVANQIGGTKEKGMLK